MATDTVQDDNAQAPLSEAEFEQVSQFVITLGTLAYRYGVPTYQLEAYFAQLPLSALRVHSEVYVLAPYLNAAFWRTTDTQQRHFTVRLPGVSFDLNKLSQIGQVMNHFGKERTSVAEAAARMKDIEALPAIYGMGKVALAYALCGGSFAVLLSLSWFDVLLSALISMLIYAVILQVSRSPRLINGLEVFAAIVSATVATTVARYVPGSNPSTVALCAVIVLVPGLALTLGVGELVAKSIQSGMGRLVDGAVISLKLFIGISIGTTIITTLFVVPPPAAVPPAPAALKLLAAALLITGLAVIFQVRSQDFAWAILAGTLAYAGVLLGGLLGNWQGSFLGATILGLYAKFFALWGHRPTSVVMLPGIMILVPGVAAFFSLGTLATSGAVGGVTALLGVLGQIAAIIAGLITAASLVPSKATL